MLLDSQQQQQQQQQWFVTLFLRDILNGDRALRYSITTCDLSYNENVFDNLLCSWVLNHNHNNNINNNNDDSLPRFCLTFWVTSVLVDPQQQWQLFWQLFFGILNNNNNNINDSLPRFCVTYWVTSVLLDPQQQHWKQHSAHLQWQLFWQAIFTLVT